MISAFVAYFFDIIATAVTALSYLFQKKAHHQLEEKGVDKDKETANDVKVYRQPLWLLGFSIGIAGGLVHIAVLPYCDLVLLSTTSLISIVCSNILAIKFLGEKIIWKYDLASFILIVIGCMGIMLLSEVDDEEPSADMIKGLLSSFQTMFFLLLFVISVVASLFLTNLLIKAVSKFEREV